MSARVWPGFVSETVECRPARSAAPLTPSAYSSGQGGGNLIRRSIEEIQWIYWMHTWA